MKFLNFFNFSDFQNKVNDFMSMVHMLSFWNVLFGGLMSGEKSIFRNSCYTAGSSTGNILEILSKANSLSTLLSLCCKNKVSITRFPLNDH